MNDNDNDNRRPRWGMLGILLVVLGTFYGSGQFASSEKAPDADKLASRSQATADKEATAGGSGGENDYRRPYLEFRGRPHGRSRDAPDPSWNLGDLLASDAKEGELEARFLIAMVPDPIDSRFGYRFDAVLDALQMAVETSRWRFDRSWLPWWPSGRQFSDRDKVEPVLISTPSGLRPLHAEKPGVVLFRQDHAASDGKKKLLVLLLVGETPTYGVAQEALSESLDIVASYVAATGSQAAPDPVRSEVQVVGPIFSGTAPSLESTLSGWLTEQNRRNPRIGWDVTVRSGAADRIDKAIFEADASRGTVNATVRYTTTVRDLDIVMQELAGFLKQCNGNHSLGKVALLTESDTEFGDIPRETSRQWFAPPTVVTTMKFPFHISQVAVAYDQSDRKAAKNTPTLIRPSSRLTIPFDETGRPRDVIPSLSPAMTTATSEFVMSKILETIALEDFRYIGIVASDTRDTIFLAGLIRQYCPDVQLFGASGDLLLGHPRYTSELRGMIVAAPYPLFSLAQRWDPPYEGDRRRHLFAHQGDQGVFNATVSLLAPPEKYYESLFDYGPPFDEMDDLPLFWQGRGRVPVWHRGSRPSCWSFPVHRTGMRPGVWIDIIGARGLWPVRNVTALDQEENRELTFSARHSSQIGAEEFARQFLALIPQFSWQWGTVFIGLGVAAWVLFCHHSIMVRTTRESGLPAGLRSMEALDPPAQPAPAPVPAHGPWARRMAPRDLYIVAGLVAFTVTYLYVGLTPCWIAFHESPWPMFLRKDLFELAPSNDRWDIRFGWLAFYAGHVTLAALAWTVVRRVGFALGFDDGLVRKYAVAAVVLLVLGAGLYALVQGARDQGLAAYCGRTAWPLIRGATGWNLGFFPWILLPAATAALLAVLYLAWRPVRDRPEVPERTRTWAVAGEVALLLLVGLPPCLALPELFQRQWAQDPHHFPGLLFFERAVNFGSGVSPFVPVLMLLAVFFLWVRQQMRRIDLAERYWGPASQGQAAGNPPPERLDRPEAERRLGLMRTAHEEAKRRVRQVLPSALWERFWVVSALAVGVIVLLRLGQRSIPTVDFPGSWTTFIMIVAWFLALTVILALSRLLLVWQGLDRLLRRFVRLPMYRAFDRIPPVFSRSFGRYLDKPRTTPELLAIPVQQWAVVAQSLDEKGVAARLKSRYLAGEAVSPPRPGQHARFEAVARLITTWDSTQQMRARGPEAAKRIQAMYQEEIEPVDDGTRRDDPARIALAGSRTWTSLLEATRGCFELLDPYWQANSVRASFGDAAPDPAGKGTTSDDAFAGTDAAERQWLRAAEELIALVVVARISQISVHLRNQAGYLAVAPLLLMLAVSVYPFQPQRFLEVCLWGLIVTVTGCVVWVYVGMERDELLSRVSKTTPDTIQFDHQFLGSVLTFIVPLLGFVLAQFPFVSDALNQWFDPIGRVLK